MGLDPKPNLLGSLSLLEEFESRLFTEQDNALATGIANRRWWVRQDRGSLVMRLTSVHNRLKQLERNGGLAVPRLLSLLIAGRRCGGKIAADAVFLKSNVRAFYLPRRLTAKFAAANSPCRLKDEAASRAILVQSRHIHVPRIVAVVESANRCCILEELIEGSPIPRNSVSAELARLIWQFYECNGITGRSITNTTDMDEAAISLREALVAMGKTIADWGQAKKLGEILQRMKPVQVPIGRCHGDLSRGNLVRVEDRTYMVDLERSHLGCLWRDLAKLCLQSESFFTGAEECYHVWCRKHGFPLAPAREVLAGTLLVAVHEHWKTRGQDGWDKGRLGRLVGRLDQALKFTKG